MSDSPIRVLIVDDSVFMRSMLKSALTKAEDITVVATAQNGQEGLKKLRELKPDVMTLDVEMPGLTGLQVLEQVMKDSPLPVIMVSTKTQKGAEATLDALQIGAVDCVAKPLGEKSATLQTFRDSVTHAVRTAAASNRDRLAKPKRRVAKPTAVDGFPEDALVAIGISAGGPATLHEMIPAIPEQFPPVVITQHMPGGFTKPFAKRMDAHCRIHVKEAEDGEPIRPGTVFIAPGDKHFRVKRRASGIVAALDHGPKVSGFRPSVDVLFDSVAGVVGGRAVGVIMTGMGNDGSLGVKLLKEKGAPTIAQDKATSIVYGMPKAAFETGCIDRVAALGDIPQAICDALAAMLAVHR
jgi:two-component system, chemotaxis family, protein-glutamate methylesterase/glutaminase